MSVEIKFIGQEEPFTYEDGEGNEYRYQVEGSGALAVFEKTVGKTVPRDALPIAVYGPAAWFSVTGTALGASDRGPGRLAGF
ncbi:hypothetical protein [Streptomyces sp. NPDC005549]|uniref:hypothetical protein n=1 Tax=Streptomyces sp. NPDC005549 TaxID=3154888 RepID=UPI0033A8625B